MGENDKPQEVQFGKQPATANPDVNFGKVAPSGETVTNTPGDSTPDHDPGIVPEFAGGDPVPDDADSAAADDGSDESDSAE